MGTGGTLSPSSPESFKTRLSQLRTLPLALLPSTRLKNRTVKADLKKWLLSKSFFLPRGFHRSDRLPELVQALDLLVSASSRIAALSPPTYLLIVS